MRTTAAFTLLELLIVACIIILLMGMLMPMLQTVQRSAMRNRTEVVLAKTDAALHQFKSEFGVYPYQLRYADPAQGGSIQQQPNQLAYQLGCDITAQDAALVHADMDAAAAQYAYTWQASSQSEGPQSSSLTYRASDTTPQFGANGWWAAAAAIQLNRMAQSRVRLAVLAGDVQPSGPLLFTAAGSLLSDRSGTPALTSPASSEHPGWAVDYLHGDIDPHCIKGNTLCDAWGNPLIYICQQLPAMRGTTALILGLNLPPFDASIYGLGAQGFDPATGPAGGLVSGGRGLLLAGGRIRLSRTDAGDGHPTPPDAAFFPDATQLMHADMRFYAAPGFETEFELWSAGPDGSCSYLRDDPANHDNISVVDYNRGLR